MIPLNHRQFVSCSGFSEYVCNLRSGQDFELVNVLTAEKNTCLANLLVI